MNIALHGKNLNKKKLLVLEAIIENIRSNEINIYTSKELKQNPLDIANKLKKTLSESDLFQSVDVANPGFINFKFNVKAIVQNINTIIKSNANYGKNNSGKREF